MSSSPIYGVSLDFTLIEVSHVVLLTVWKKNIAQLYALFINHVLYPMFIPIVGPTLIGAKIWNIQ